MNKNDEVDIDKLFEEGKAIDEAMKRAVREAVLEHKKAGNPIAAWRDGKVVWIPAEEIEVEESGNV